MSLYNEPIDWVRSAIDSILCQTFTNYEFIIVNDNPERSENRDLLNIYSKKDSRIKIIENERNLGLTKSLNIALKNANGEYVARMDADDISVPERFEKQLNYLCKNPNVFLVGASAFTIDEFNKKKGSKKVIYDERRIFTSLFFCSPFIHPTIVFKRVEKGILVQYDERLRYAQDFGFYVKYSSEHMHNMDDYLLFYRISSSQISQKNLTAQNECAHIIIGDLLDKYNVNIGNNGVDTLYGIDYDFRSIKYIDIEDFCKKIMSQVSKIENIDIDYFAKILCLRVTMGYINFYSIREAVRLIMRLARIESMPFKYIIYYTLRSITLKFINLK